MEKLGVRPLAQVVDTVVVGTDPKDYGIAPVKAVWKLLDKVGLTLNSIGIWEIHEAYAVQVLAVLKELRLSPKRVNRWGGAIGLGHPFGMSGVRLVLTAARQLQEFNEEYAIVAMCIGGGQGEAMLLRRA